MDYSLIGKRIREQRLKLSFTQEQLAEKAKISTNFLSCIESGLRKGSFETYIKLSNALNTSLDMITQDIINEAEINIFKKELNNFFDALDKSDQHLAVKILGELYRHKHQ